MKDIKDYDTKIQTPRKCIRDYCLMHCEKKGRKNSKRDVVECIHTHCPIYPYRTGQLKGRRGPISERTRRNRISRLEYARKLVGTAERDLGLEHEKLKKKQKVVDEQMKKIKAAEKKVEDRKKKVRKLEILFNDELEAGIWNSNRMDVEEVD